MHCRLGDPQHLRGLLARKARKKPQLDQFRFARILGSQFVERIVEGDQVHVSECIRKRYPLHPTTMFGASALDKNAPHRFGRGRKAMTARLRMVGRDGNRTPSRDGGHDGGYNLDRRRKIYRRNF